MVLLVSFVVVDDVLAVALAPFTVHLMVFTIFQQNFIFERILLKSVVRLLHYLCIQCFGFVSVTMLHLTSNVKAYVH